MRILGLTLFLWITYSVSAQQSDFKDFNFKKVDFVAKNYKAKRLYDLNNITYNLTKDFDTEVEKFRAIFIWITHNISNDYKLYAKNSRKRKRFKDDSIKLEEWNSKFKKIIFKKLIRKKRTICTGYAYLLKEMSDVIGVKAEIVHGFGKTAEVDVEKLEDPNHSWNVVNLNGKWYLCDPTWAAGISYPDKGKFVFSFNDGLFLTDPNLFIYNHFPIYEQYTLLPKPPSLKEFAHFPLLYSDSYTLLESHIAPKEMHQEIVQNDVFQFEYKLASAVKIEDQAFKLVTVSSVMEKTYKPEVSMNGQQVILKHQFKRRGFYDVHIYMNDSIIASYTFNIKKAP
ncbi:MAG: hypothetical protein CMB99_05375 [Flavobacteriaceae bacterium]|nr:hypothetical protein [Flavobacteriaceae bacterium]|tara:strand:+ start:27297 stop:28316 length:1020 start_codon:yes stop_codon:yes gene_type:complete